MTVAVRLRCTCRRHVGAIEHGDDRVVFGPDNVDTVRRKPRSMSGNDVAWTGVIASSTVDGIADLSIKCRRCGHRLEFAPTALHSAMQRATTTGKTQDVVSD